jgi:hypothetical protein
MQISRNSFNFICLTSFVKYRSQDLVRHLPYEKGFAKLSVGYVNTCVQYLLLKETFLIPHHYLNLYPVGIFKENCVIVISAGKRVTVFVQN